jgi:hypothetical protein
VVCVWLAARDIKIERRRTMMGKKIDLTKLQKLVNEMGEQAFMKFKTTDGCAVVVSQDVMRKIGIAVMQCSTFGGPKPVQADAEPRMDKIVTMWGDIRIIEMEL